MAKIIIFGGSSELGINAAEHILSSQPRRYSKIIKVLRQDSLKGAEDELAWDPSNGENVANFISKLNLSQGDLAIIATGSISRLDNVTDFPSMPSDQIERIIWVNFTLPLLVTARVSEKLISKGGGDLIIFTSASAFPPQQSNLIYTHSKSMLDAILRQLTESLSKQNVNTKIVRSSFSDTRLNQGRKATPLSVTPQEVGVAVSTNFKLGTKIIWVPRVFVLVSIALRFVPGLSQIANSLVRRSKSTAKQIE